VILDAVIDEHGKISDLKLMHGLGQPIDDVVIATVRQWSFAPATRNGVPIPSEQELHFHYERS
jgi:protein TonB